MRIRESLGESHELFVKMEDWSAKNADDSILRSGIWHVAVDDIAAHRLRLLRWHVLVNNADVRHTHASCESLTRFYAEQWCVKQSSDLDAQMH